jgi:mannonate dehydratase
MEKTWRWFGKNDKITLDMLRQIGVEGIVTALHHIPNGEIWSSEEILEYKKYIENYGLRWSVVESLPVSEAIKYAGPNREQLIDNYISQYIFIGKGIKKDGLIQTASHADIDNINFMQGKVISS